MFAGSAYLTLSTLLDAFDHFLVSDAELCAWVQQGCHDGAFGVGVDHCTSICTFHALNYMNIHDVFQDIFKQLFSLIQSLNKQVKMMVCRHTKSIASSSAFPYISLGFTIFSEILRM